MEFLKSVYDALIIDYVCKNNITKDSMLDRKKMHSHQ